MPKCTEEERTSVQGQGWDPKASQEDGCMDTSYTADHWSAYHSSGLELKLDTGTGPFSKDHNRRQGCPRPLVGAEDSSRAVQG